jgi:hypothetical protein
MLPILSSNTNIGCAITILVDAVFDPSRVAPIDDSASAAGCLATASVLSAVGLAGAGLEYPGICHREESEQNGNSSSRDLGFENLRSLKGESAKVFGDGDCGRYSD